MLWYYSSNIIHHIKWIEHAKQHDWIWHDLLCLDYKTIATIAFNISWQHFNYYHQFETVVFFMFLTTHPNLSWYPTASKSYILYACRTSKKIIYQETPSQLNLLTINNIWLLERNFWAILESMSGILKCE
jgi:hypothetical protein